MKKLFVFLTALLTVLTATAQEDFPIVIEQETFRKVNADALTGVNIDPIAKDLSRNACARVKIKFANMTRAEIDALEIKFQTNTDLARQEVAQYFDNVLILEMTAKPMTRFFVKHPTLGESNEVRLNLEGDCEYEMMAHLNQRFSIIVESSVAGADVLIDGVKKAVTDSSFRATIDDVMVGSHNLKLSYNGIAAEQTIEVKKGSISFHLDVDKSALEPQYVVFSVTPENAVVIVDNEYYTLTEGMVLLVRPRGTYNYTITAAGYHSQSGTFTVEGQKVEKIITLKADAANVTLTVADGAEIWVNGALKGTSRWSGMLSSGTYIFEARKAGHKSTTLSKTITSASANQSYTLPAPTPIVGKLTISSTPLMADVTLDGKPVGRTPIDIPNLLVGNHTLKVSKAGYADHTQTIAISEGKTTTVSPTLIKQVASTPTPASTPTTASGTYNIGDLVTINGVQGVVFQTSPVVKIVSVRETTAKWSVNCQTTTITDSDNGRGNTYKIRSKSDWRNQYPAFRWCVDYGSGWYLPAINELNAIYAQKDKINKTLSANGMDKLCSKASTLWSSTEQGQSLACSVYLSGGSFGSSTKYNINAVRAVLTLN